MKEYLVISAICKIFQNIASSVGRLSFSGLLVVKLICLHKDVHILHMKALLTKLHP